MGENELLARGILEEVCETDEIFDDYDMDLIEEGFIDSFSVLAVIMAVEDKMGIRLQPSELSKDSIRTVNNVIELIGQLEERQC